MTVGLEDVIAMHIAGESSMTKRTSGRERPTLDEVSRLAYHFYEQRGRQNGRDVEDWLLAEQELTHHYA